ncbi:MAG TPA: hypothetical protein VFM50_02895, partial [Nocardioidaceae bacterium]|nr:hypothetical protein [Nocardioidaceae bacterium]
MAGTTSNRSYRFPQASDDYVPHTDIENLATDVDADVALLLDAENSPLPLGVIAQHTRSSNSSATSGSTELGILRIDSVPLYAGRIYRIGTNSLLVDGSIANDVARVFLRANSAGTATTSSTQLAIGQTVVPNVSFPNGIQVSCLYAPASDETLSILLSVGRQTGTGSFVVLGSASGVPMQLSV